MRNSILAIIEIAAYWAGIALVSLGAGCALDYLGILPQYTFLHFTVFLTLWTGCYAHTDSMLKAAIAEIEAGRATQ